MKDTCRGTICRPAKIPRPPVVSSSQRGFVAATFPETFYVLRGCRVDRTNPRHSHQDAANNCGLGATQQNPRTQTRAPFAVQISGDSRADQIEHFKLNLNFETCEFNTIIML